MRPMSDTQHIQSSVLSIRSSDKLEDAFRKMKVSENGVAQSNPYPDRPGERDCQFYLRTGLCGYGSSCRYNHPTHLPQGIVYYKEELPERIGQPDCEYFLKTGACKYGSTCKYHHPKDRNGAQPVLFNVIGLPMRQGEKPCPYYLRTGTCRFGVACKFHHPQPDNGHSTAYGMSSFPSPGLQYANGLTLMSTYGTLPRPQVPQSYVPIMVSPSQGLLPLQGWATYMAASNSMYNVKNQPYYSGSSASVPMAVALNHGLPESSEQPECRFFMNTGTCKYGDDCKYNHPGVRISPPPPPPPPNLLNSFLLPARPGQPACGNFRSYGFCKFGPNCKFDHPVTMSSSLPTPYASPVSTHQRISALPSRSDSKSLSNGKPDVKKESSETEKLGDDSEQLHNSEVQDSENASSP